MDKPGKFLVPLLRSLGALLTLTCLKLTLLDHNAFLRSPGLVWHANPISTRPLNTQFSRHVKQIVFFCQSHILDNIIIRTLLHHAIEGKLYCPINRNQKHSTPQFGFVWVLVVGGILSLVWRHKQPWEKAGRRTPDPALFTPPLARLLKARCDKEKSVQV